MQGRRIDLIGVSRGQAWTMIGLSVLAIPIGIVVTLVFGALIIGIVLGPLLIIAGLIGIPWGIWQLVDPTRHKALRALGTTDAERRQVIAAIDHDLALPATWHLPMGKSSWMSLPPGWIVVHGSVLFIARAVDLLWVFKSVTVRKRYGFTTGKTHALVIHGRRGKQEIPIDVQYAPALLDAIGSVAPQAFMGYLDRLDGLNQAALEKLVTERSGSVPQAILPSAFAFPPGGGPLQPKSRTWIWALGGGAVLAGGCLLTCAGVAGFGMFLERRTSALAAACDGSAVPDAAGYNPGTHPAVAAMHRTDSGWAASYDIVPSSFTSADTTEEAALVLCVENEQRVTLETCQKNGISIGDRTRWQRSARVVVARAGRVLETGVVSGAEPPACANLASGDSAEGPHPDAAAWTAFLRGALD